VEPLSFGLYLKTLREEANLSMGKLAKEAEISQPYISQIENGDRGIPSPEILKKLAKPLSVDYFDLMDKAGYLTSDYIGSNSNDALNKESFGAYIKGLRTSKGLTLTELGDLIGYSNPYLSQIENGKKKGMPSPELLKLLSSPLGVEYHELMAKAGYWTVDSGTVEQEVDIEKLLSNNSNIIYRGSTLTEDELKRIVTVLELLFPNR